MKHIDESIYSSKIPNLNESFFSNLTDTQKKIYLNSYALYVNFLYDFFKRNTCLKRYDNEIKNNREYSFPLVEESDMDIYQYMSKLNYFYLRNNIYIERLSVDELNYLSTASIYDSEMDKFIRSTLKRVIFEDTDLNDTLVIGERFNDNDMNLSKEMNSDRKKYISELCSRLQNELSRDLSMNVKVIEYNDESIKKSENIDSMSISR